jgi:hypothetical protein
VPVVSKDEILDTIVVCIICIYDKGVKGDF